MLESLDPSGSSSAEPGKVEGTPAGISIGIHPEYTAADRDRLKAVVNERMGAFASCAQDMPGYQGGEVGWKMLKHGPIWCHPNSRRFTAAELAIIKEKCNELLDAGFIEERPSNNMYSSMPLLAAQERCSDLFVH